MKIDPHSRYARWLYRGGRPNRMARVMNGFWRFVHGNGLLVPKGWAALEVRGRRSGKTVVFPVVVAEYEGRRYLVSMLGERANWVRNVRAAKGKAVLRHGRRCAVHLEEVEAGRRAPILRRYLACAPGARPHVPVDPRAPLEEFERVAPRVPVFEITSG